MDDEPQEIRSWLSDVLSKRVRRPALEETIFHQLDELERGPLEQLAALVHMVVDELRLAGQRLNDQTRDLRSLRDTVVQLHARVDALAVPPPAAPGPPGAEGHLLLLSTADGYRIVEVEGPPPAPGGELERDGRRFVVQNRRASPYPGDRRPCVLALSSRSPSGRPA